KIETLGLKLIYFTSDSDYNCNSFILDSTTAVGLTEITGYLLLRSRSSVVSCYFREGFTVNQSSNQSIRTIGDSAT
ncbi:unnamed protein product, partial [Amoebophrya sp. A25]